MKTIVFILPIEPKGQKRDRIATIAGHARSYKDPAQKKYESKLGALLKQYQPSEPHLGALELEIRAFLPIPVSKPKKWKTLALQGFIRPTTKPDFDNIIKGLSDVMNGVFFRDDAQIIRGVIEKWYGENPRWEIRLVMYGENEGHNCRCNQLPEPETDIDNPF
jgi:Holliday junction resolvase RusA-like endonuclease